MRACLLLVLPALVALAGCDRPAPAAGPASASAAIVGAPTISASSARAPEPPGSIAAPPAPALTLFDTPEEAFDAVLAQKPRVLAVGEAHAQKGTEGVASSAQRFTRQLLPRLQGKASDLLVELMLPAAGCQKKAEAVREKQKVVTEKQAEGDQNEYLTMGREAKKRGIVPDLLRPSCADLDAIDKAGQDAIVVSLRTIARLTREQAIAAIARGDKQGDKPPSPPMVVTYGGAMHNDTSPPPERADWSFGDALSARVEGRYIELDLYVPELIQDTDSWRRLPWYPHYDRTKNPGKTTLFQLGPRSYVLIFPVTAR
ncbi:MAG: hypothetical protein U0359_13315 [Byssovorax sp.]